MKRLLTAKLLISSSTTSLMLTLSPFDIVNHVKYDPRTYIEYFELRKYLKLKSHQHQSLDLFKLYNFDIKFILI